jgi:hypothetical protein
MLSSTDLAGMRSTQAASMWDTCRIVTHTETQDAAGQPVETWTPGSAIACRFAPGSSRERRGELQRPAISDATVYFPLGTTITSKDRIQVTARYGTALSTAETWQVASDPPPVSGPTALRVELLKVKA